jgi:hypothetical protein
MGTPGASLLPLANNVRASFARKAVSGRDHDRDRRVQLSSSTTTTGERGRICPSQALRSDGAERWISDPARDRISDRHFTLSRSLAWKPGIASGPRLGGSLSPSGAKRKRFTSCRLTAVMRRLLATQLIVILLAPWIAALSGAAAAIVPCPMHRSGEAASHTHALRMAPDHHANGEHSSRPHHGTTARGCNCAGECGRSGTPFALMASEHVWVALHSTTEATIASEQPIFGSSARLLPLATGPPSRLRI